MTSSLHLCDTFIDRQLQKPSVSVYNSHLVQVVDSVQDLSDQSARILLGVETLFHDSVEQLAARHPGGWEDMRVSMYGC